MVPRYKNITLKFRDELKNYRTEEYEGSVSQLLQHCINHLDGKLLIDYSLSKGRFYMEK
jgi:peptide deformylase